MNSINDGSRHCLFFKTKTPMGICDDDLFTQRFRKLGCSASLVECLTITFNEQSKQELDFMFDNLTDQQKFVATSQQSLIFLEQYLNEKAITKEAQSSWHNNKMYTVGPSTALRAKQMGYIDVKGENCGNAHELSKLIEHDVQLSLDKHQFEPLLKYIILVGNKRGEQLTTMFDRNGVNYREIVMYNNDASPPNSIINSVHMTLKAVPTQNKDRVLWAVFFSPSSFSAAECVLNELQNQSCKFASIGKTTADFITGKGFTVNAIAETPTPESLLMAITKSGY